MTAVSIVGQLIFVFNLAVFGGLSGPGIYGAQYFGQGNTEGFRNTFRLKLWISGAVVIGGIAVFLLGDETLIGLYLRGESTDVDPVLTMEYAKQYLFIMLIGLVPFAMTQIYASSLRETGESLKPMIAGVTSVVVDIVFNYLLIYGKFGMPELGVRGAAIATVLSRFAEFAVVVIWSCAAKKKHVFLIGIYRRLTVPKELSVMIIKKGLPIFFNEFLWAGGIAALTQCYSVRSLDVIAGMNISNAICNLLNVVFIALGSAVGIIIGQTLGAHEYEKARDDAFALMKFTGVICLGLTAVLVSVSGVFPGLYDTTQEIRQYGSWFITITALFFPVQGFLNALYFTLRSGGKTMVTFLFDSVYSWVVPVPCAYILCNFTGLSVLLIYTIVQAADIIKLIVGYILIKKGVWISNIVDASEK
jgi:putative MATE family efflux protein